MPFGLRWRDQLPPVVVDEFENLINDILAHFSVTHDEDGNIDPAVIEEAVDEAIDELNIQDGKQGPPGIDGEDGEQGIPGKQGIQGIQGIRGPMGFPGEDGDDAWPFVISSGGGSGTPGGSDTQVQFNDGGVFGGDAGLTYNKTTDQLTLAGLLDISGAAAGQIKFPSSQNASADANTLDDYEEGSFTPVVSAETPGDLSVTYTIQAGRYVKIGRIVIATFTIETATFTHTTASGDVLVTGLPFTAETISGFITAGPLIFNNVTKAGYTTFVAQVSSNEAQSRFFASASGIGSSKIAITNMPTGGATQLVATLIYRV